MSPRAGPRQFMGGTAFTPEQFSGLSMYSGGNAPGPYDYGNDQPSGAGGASAQQGYDMLNYGAQAGYNVPMPNYGWGNVAQPGSMGFGGLGYAMNPSFGSGLPPGSNGGGNRARPAVNPISPPTTQAQYRKQ